uniref:FH2 domain containing 3 n=1 Tax=Mastacembelus armatus TaxID=205130 RepID=A0A3Q3LZY7_9TELE
MFSNHLHYKISQFISVFSVSLQAEVTNSGILPYIRRSMKKLNWDTIPSQHVLGKLNVWTSNRPQRDLVLDVRTMEELFSQVDKRASLHNSRILGLKKCDGLDLFPQEPQVNSLKSQTIIVKQLLSFSGNLSALPEADRFMVQLVKVPGYEERLKTMVLREEFFPLMEEVKNSVAVMTKAANELLDCDDLHSVIRLVLKAGNYMNAGGYSANAIGFRMTSLLKLADTKANKPGMNLMHYVAKCVTVAHHHRICKEEIITDFEREVKKIKEAKLYSSRHPGLLQQLETFLLRADAKLAEVESSLQELKSTSNAVAEYFCEDPATFKLEECCSIFHSFCKRFDTAVQENREREAAEQRRKRKESMRTATKRHSTLSGSGPESDQDSSCLESALLSFLSTAPEGLSRCRRNLLPTIEGSPIDHRSQTVPSDETSKTTPCTKEESPDKKQLKLQTEDHQVEALENKEEAKKMCEITRKVLHHQNSRCNPEGDSRSGTPCRSERGQDTPATPSSPRPRTRDFFFANNGDLGSPWTILSPFTCPRKNTPQQNRQTLQLRLLSLSDEGNLDDGVWENDHGNDLADFDNQDSRSFPCGGSVYFPVSNGQRAVSRGPVHRSVSMDETTQSPASAFRLGDLFQRRNHINGQMSTSGFISFFRRIGGRSKPGEVEQSFKESNA